MTSDERIQFCERQIEYRFKDSGLLVSALTHSSSANSRAESNERLEFLGDAILGWIVCDRLYANYPELDEGELTKIKSSVVSRKVCAKFSLALQLDRCLILGRGMLMQDSIPRSLLSDVFEAIVAAIYLDGGMEQARSFVLRCVDPEIQLAYQGSSLGNFKSALQHLAQRDLAATPCYQLVEQRGPDHSKFFCVRAEIGGRKFTPAWGRSKKDAEQKAAGNALAEIRKETLPFENVGGPSGC